uniref:Uncharacterized protein n=1 Tax=Oryza glumipatula TaxID=40148 RepID=A0A0D9ZW63_9ORYZ
MVGRFDEEEGGGGQAGRHVHSLSQSDTAWHCVAWCNAGMGHNGSVLCDVLHARDSASCPHSPPILLPGEAGFLPCSSSDRHASCHVAGGAREARKRRPNIDDPAENTRDIPIYTHTHPSPFSASQSIGS